MRTEFDVVILGGGLVGSALALALAAPGFSVALVDPVAPQDHAAQDFDGRAYAVAPASSRLLGVLGVWEGVLAGAEPVRRIEVADRQTDPVPPAELHFDPAEAGQAELGWIVPDGVLRGALLQALDAVDVAHFAPASGFITDRGTGWADVTAGDQAIRARLVVACDGRRSGTARAAGIDYLAWGYEQIGLVSAISHSRPHHGLAHQSFFAGGPFAVLPLQGNQSSLVWSDRAARARQVQAMPDDVYLAEIQARIGGRLGEITLVGKRWAHPLGLSLAHDYAVHRLVVAGDAAHGVHPIAGQGMNMGLRDVAALVEVLTEAARRGEDIGALGVLQRYQQWRRPDATAMALGMDALTRGFSTAVSPVQAVRNAGLGVVAANPGLRRVFMKLASGPAGPVPRMMLGQPV